MLEASNKIWSSNMLKMHASGHDGHMAMLFRAAKLRNTRNFKSSVALILQPAKEDGLGGQRIVQGRAGSPRYSKSFGPDNTPRMEIGKFGISDGPIKAALDEFDLV
ncbi:amidohydrolase [Bradyrhizobium sp. Rc2d]|uniref:amidohydrolase n=1 Tax=Bradyrhizobium sp. Rc2d TaxID=1855321 RepID=UPI00115FAF52|nr:amidohydrolase [Bradyrhizobium sp. Rc2d]